MLEQTKAIWLDSWIMLLKNRQKIPKHSITITIEGTFGNTELEAMHKLMRFTLEEFDELTQLNVCDLHNGPISYQN